MEEVESPLPVSPGAEVMQLASDLLAPLAVEMRGQRKAVKRFGRFRGPLPNHCSCRHRVVLFCGCQMALLLIPYVGYRVVTTVVVKNDADLERRRDRHKLLQIKDL